MKNLLWAAAVLAIVAPAASASARGRSGGARVSRGVSVRHVAPPARVVHAAPRQAAPAGEVAPASRGLGLAPAAQGGHRPFARPSGGGGVVRRGGSSGWGNFGRSLGFRGTRGAEGEGQDGPATQFGALIRTNGLGARMGGPSFQGEHAVDAGGLIASQAHRAAPLGGGGTHWGPPDRLPPPSPGGSGGGASGGNSITPNGGNTIINTGNGVGNGNGGGGVGNGNGF